MSDAAPNWDHDLLEFWFEELTAEQRFKRDPAVDDQIVRRFVPVWERLRDSPSAAFLTDAKTARAAVLLFDQVPRNAFRDDPRAFASDVLARSVADGAIARGWDAGLSVEQRQFLYMPFMHSEALADQQRSLALFGSLGDEFVLEFARGHHAMIARFGRFPHRNRVLGRSSTPAEEAAVAAGNAW
jgi:uncharacterized protein (DUF924 family)